MKEKAPNGAPSGIKRVIRFTSDSTDYLVDRLLRDGASAATPANTPERPRAVPDRDSPLEQQVGSLMAKRAQRAETTPTAPPSGEAA